MIGDLKVKAAIGAFFLAIIAYLKFQNNRMKVKALEGKNKRLEKVTMKQAESAIEISKARQVNQGKIDDLQKAIDAGTGIDLE